MYYPTALPSDVCLVRDRVTGCDTFASARFDLRTGASGTTAFSRFLRTTGGGGAGGAFSDATAFSFSYADDVVVVTAVVTAGLVRGEEGAEERGEEDVETPVPSISTKEWNKRSSCSFSGIGIDAHALRGGSKNSEDAREITPAPDRIGDGCKSNTSGLSRASCFNATHSAPTNTSSTRMPTSRTAVEVSSPFKVVGIPSSCTRRPSGLGNHIASSGLRNTSRIVDGIFPAPACRVTACATERGTHVPPMGSGARETVMRGVAWVYDTSAESGSPSMAITGVRLTNEVSIRRRKGTLGARSVW